MGYQCGAGARRPELLYGSEHPTPPILPPPDLDLDAYSEVTRRRLYDLVTLVFFPLPGQRQDPEEFIPPYSPDEAGLVVPASPPRRKMAATATEASATAA